MTPADRLRIAVALIALKHKPPSQSISSCVLDLQAGFRGVAPLTYVCDRSWRAHAQHMEEEVNRLQAQLDAERIKNDALGKGAVGGSGSQTTQLSSSLSNSPSVSLKKKPKKKQGQAAAGVPTVPIPVVQSEDVVCLKLLAPWASCTPVDHLLKLSAVITREVCDTGIRKPLARLASAFSAAIEALSLELGSVVGSSSALGSEATKSIDVHASVLEYIVTAVLPLLVVPAGGGGGEEELLPLDGCLRSLSKRILQPCVQSFVPLSIQLLGELRQGRVTDLRYHMLALVRTLLTALFSLQPSLTVVGIFDSLVMSLVLGTLTELRQTLFSDDSHGCGDRNEDARCDQCEGECKRVWDLGRQGKRCFRTTATRGSSAASQHLPRPPTSALPDWFYYEKHLAKKDGVWFLCAVLRLLSSSFDGARVSPPASGFFFSESSSSSTTGSSSAEEQESSRRWNVTCEQMRKAVVDDLLRLLSECTKRCKPSWSNDYHQAPPINLQLEVGVAAAERGSQNVAHVSEATKLREEVAVTRHTSGMGESDERKEALYWIDEAEHAMIMGMAERLLLVYAA